MTIKEFGTIEEAMTFIDSKRFQPIERRYDTFYKRLLEENQCRYSTYYIFIK